MDANAFETQTLADLLAVLAVHHASAPALWWAGRATTFGELDEQANQVARALRFEAATGVAVLAKDTPLSFVVLFGASKAGVPVTFVNWRLTPPEVGFIVRDCGCSHLFVGPTEAAAARASLEAQSSAPVAVIALGGFGGVGHSFAEWVVQGASIELVVTRNADAPAVILYTSGTTGFPKGVQLPHRALLAIRRAQQRAGVDWWQFSRTDVALHSLPLFHVGGLWWAVNILACGASLVTTSQFDADKALQLIDEHDVSVACWVPAMLRLVLDARKRAPNAGRTLRTIAYGGSPTVGGLLLEVRRAFGCRLLQFYGLTETGNTAVCLKDEDHVSEGPRLAAAGRPYPGVRVRCVGPAGEDCAALEIGEVWLASPANMTGYWRRPEETASVMYGQWLRTGDAGYLDADGFLYICDRIKDMIISAGENIYPAEVERVLKGFPLVRDVAVIGVPDERWGEAVKAFVVASETFDTKELLRYLKDKLAAYKVPRSVDFVEALPRTPSGKVMKQKLREPYWIGRTRQVN